MADMSFDVVIVGGGNKVCVAAMYLTKYGGMSVGIFEERHELMTGWCCEEAPAPGFLAHQCSHYHVSYRDYHRPIYEDIPEWVDYGAKYLDHKVTIAFVDKKEPKWCGVYTRDTDPTQEKTYKLFARFSQKDADKWMWIMDKIEKYWEPAVLEWVFNPAVPFPEPDALDKLLLDPGSGMDPLWAYMSPNQVYRELFESPFIQATFSRGIQSGGVQPDGAGQGIAAITSLVLWLDGGVVKGGNHQLAHATQRVILENGGKVFTRSPVKKVLIENGRAKGIRLEDGTEIEAKKAVLCGVDPYQLVFELVGPEHFDPIDVMRVKNLEMDWITISWYTWAMHERPKYLAEEWDPDIKYSGWLTCGDKDIDMVAKESFTRRMFEWPDVNHFQMIASDHCIIDPSYAPPGKHVVLTEMYVNPAWRYTEAEWKEIEKRHADEMLTHWQKYAPNMTWDNIIGYLPVTPFYTSRHARNWGRAGNWNVIDTIPSQVGRNRPTPNLARGKMPVKGLYATGAGFHPWGWAQSWQGYNIYKVMSEDFGLRQPWKEKGRPF
jgi:phytoene dehydrogenase-like protein